MTDNTTRTVERTPVSLDDYERLAQRVLDDNAWAYVAGGAGDELTLHWNRDAFQKYAILPRVLVKSDAPSTSFELFGRTLTHPIIVAPLAYQRLLHPHGESATALAAAAQESTMVLSTLASTTIEAAASVEGGSCRWFQLYMQERRDDTMSLVRRAEDAGYEAIVLTVDAPLSGARNREQRIGFRLPEGVRAENLVARPATHQSSPDDGPTSAVFSEYLRNASTWQDVEWLVGKTRLPVLIKGIAHPDDADIAIQRGARGIIVSNHGGRTLDTIPATLDLLAPIVDRTSERVPLLVDGGIRRGTDVYKCLALGATAVLVGRPILYGLAVAGARGVSHVLRILRDEFEIAMMLSGCMTISQITRDRLVRSRRL